MAMYVDEDIENDNSSENETEEKPKSRSNGRIYDLAFVSFRHADTAERLLKYKFMGAYWKRVGLKGDVLWYECKCCHKRLKLQLLDIQGRCQASFEVDFFEKEHDLIAENQTGSQAGLRPEIKDKILAYQTCGGKPATIMEQLRKEGTHVEKYLFNCSALTDCCFTRKGIIVNKIQITSFLAQHRTKMMGKSKFTLRDLINWAEEHKQLPEDPNEVYVSSYTQATVPLTRGGLAPHTIVGTKAISSACLRRRTISSHFT